MLPRLVKYYHLLSVHAEGMDRLEATISRHFYHTGLREEIRKQVGTCVTCQRFKRHGGQYGELAPHDALACPWQEVHVDTIGPWRIQRRGIKRSYQAQTMLDPVTDLVELRLLPEKSGKQCARALDHGWVARYPRPMRIIHDNGPEYHNDDFRNYLEQSGIENKPVSAGNPQSNAIVEQVHKTIALVLRVLVAERPFNSAEELDLLVEDAIHTAMRATRAAAHSSLHNISPGALAFRRDMNLDIPLRADLLTLRELRQRQIDTRLIKANAMRQPHEFLVGDQVMIRRKLNHSQKLDATYTNPVRITQIHHNGTATVRLSPNQLQRYNIRRLEPFRSP